MSAKTDLRAALAAYAPLTALVGDHISADRIDQDAGRPFVVFTQTGQDKHRALDGSSHGTQTAIELQCWGDTRTSADAVADAVEAALDALYQHSTNRADGYDGDLDLEAAILTVDWWD